MGRSVAAKFGEERFFATLQWRHDTLHGKTFPPLEGKPVSANGICRVHVQEANQTVDRLATVSCLPGAGRSPTGVHSLRFGDWLVGINSDLYNAHFWAVPTDVEGRTARDVANKRDVVLKSTWMLEPNATVVMHIL